MSIAKKTTEVKYIKKVRFIPYPAGVYSSTTQYVCTEAAGPMVEYNGQYYGMYKVGTWIGTNEGRTPQEDYSLYGTQATWQLLDKYTAVFAEILFAAFAKLGSAVFLDDYMFSQYGIRNGVQSNAYQNFDPSNLDSFRPNVFVNWRTGYFESFRSKFRDVLIQGSVRTGFTEGDSFATEYSDNIVVPNPGSPGGLWEPYVTIITLPLAVASNIGRKITITVTQGEGMATVQFASGYETDIWENGEIVNTLTILGGETVELLAYGVNNVFKAWIVLSRTKPTVISAPTIKSGATCVKMQSINSSQAIKDDVTFVLIASTNSITVNLPTDAPEGRVLYIRSLNWGKVTFSGRIRFTDGTYATNNWSIEDSHPRMFIYDGSYWNEFFCSIIK